MVGFLNAHGTNPNLFSGQFQGLDFGFADDVLSDELREATGWVSIDELIDTPEEPFVEPFDEEFEFTRQSSLLPGADYDWDDWFYDEEEYQGIAVSVTGEFFLYDEYPVGRAPTDTANAEGEFAEAESFAPSFIGRNRTNIRRVRHEERRYLREKSAPAQAKQHYQKMRGKAHRKPGGWKAHSPHGRESIRYMPAWEIYCYDAMNYLADNARMNLH